MKQFTDVYKRNNNSGLTFTQSIATIFRKAETLSLAVIEAIQNKNIEKRCFSSAELVRMMAEVYDVFCSEGSVIADNPMQKYCLNNINLLTKINLKNDEKLAITLMESFKEVANTWESYQDSAAS
jgi:flagellin-specific chaperone FliS